MIDNRYKSVIKAFMDFVEYRLFGARIKVVGFSTDSSSRIAELSIWALMEEFKPGLKETFEFENRKSHYE